MKSSLSLVFLGALSCTISASTPPSDGVKLRSVGYAGTGCPQGSLIVDIAANNTRFSYHTDDPNGLAASVGAGATPSAQRRACTAQLEFTYPSGWTFRVKEYSARGYVNTTAGVTGQAVIKYFFSGVPGIAMQTTNIPDRVHGNYLITGNLKDVDSVWAPCGGDGIMNLQTSIALQQKVAGSSGRITTEGTEGIFEWSETRCSAGWGPKPAPKPIHKPTPQITKPSNATAIIGKGTRKGNSTSSGYRPPMKSGNATMLAGKGRGNATASGYRPPFQAQPKGWNATMAYGNMTAAHGNTTSKANITSRA